jgi:hypothetical protein
MDIVLGYTSKYMFDLSNTIEINSLPRKSVHEVLLDTESKALYIIYNI